jgi:hypothetical protein
VAPQFADQGCADLRAFKVCGAQAKTQAYDQGDPMANVADPRSSLGGSPVDKQNSSGIFDLGRNQQATMAV